MSFHPATGLSTLRPDWEVPNIPKAAATLRERLTLTPFRERYRAAAKRHADLRARLGALRTKGYLWFPWVEDHLASVLQRAEAAAAALPEGARAVNQAAERQLQAVEEQAIALAGTTLSPELAGALVAQFNGVCQVYQGAVSEADAAVGALESRLATVAAEIAVIEDMPARFEKSTFRLAPGEQPIAAGPARWAQDQGDPHAGMLYVSDRRVVFERDEEVVEGGFFGLFARSKRRVREVELDLALSELDAAEGARDGWVVKDEVLILRWRSGPGAPETRFTLIGISDLPDELDDAKEWAAFLPRLLARDVKGHRAEPEAWKILPDLPVLRGDPAPDRPAATPEPAPEPAPVREVWPAKAWMQVSLDLDGEGLDVALTGSSSGQQSAPVRVEGLTLADLEAFAEAVRRTAHQGVDLPAEALAQAHALFKLVMGRGEVFGAFHALRATATAAGGKLLVRLMAGDARLRGMPWEVLRGPGEGEGFLALHPDLTLVRGVYGAQPVDQGPITERPRVLVVAPGELADSGRALHAALNQAHGFDVELMPPLLGDEAGFPQLSMALMGPKPPHALHLLMHGRLDGGVAELELAGGWVAAELLAMAVKPAAARGLRLVYLESCDTARSGELASAAEQLSRNGVEAVVAQLWPVSPAGARAVSGRFYGALLGPGDARGDAAASLNVARLAAAANLKSAEFLCPVLYLRGEDPRLFAPPT